MHLNVPKRDVEISLLKKQRIFVAANQYLFLFCGGVGSGKTTAGAAWILAKAMSLPKVVGFIGSNTYSQLHKATLQPLLRLLKQFDIKHVFGKCPPRTWPSEKRFLEHDNILTLENGAQILTYSLDNYEAYRGIEVGYAWIDETRDTKQEAFDILIERLRGYGPIPYQLRVTTTPNGFDWLWNRFVNPATKLRDAGYVTSSSYENRFNPANYARDLEERLGKNLARQQVYADFLSLTQGRAFTFSRERNVKPVEYNPALPLIYSMDFNVSPMCAVVAQADREARTVNVLDEVVIPDNAQTRDACREFCRRWKRDCTRVDIYGDIAGKHRDTRGGESDWAIMLTEIRGQFQAGAREASDGRQRHVFDGIQAVNALLEPATGPARLTVSPKCHTLIRDLEQVSFKPGTRELDKSNGQLTHISDALRYPIAQLFPVSNLQIMGLNDSE